MRVRTGQIRKKCYWHPVVAISTKKSRKEEETNVNVVMLRKRKKKCAVYQKRESMLFRIFTKSYVYSDISKAVTYNEWPEMKRDAFFVMYLSSFLAVYCTLRL